MGSMGLFSFFFFFFFFKKNNKIKSQHTHPTSTIHTIFGIFLEKGRKQ